MSRTGFTCDACGEPAGLHDRRCRHCGRAFDAVRCPKCGHQGPPATFSDGCPVCRYLAEAPRPDRRAAPRRSLFVPLMTVLVVLLAGAAVWAWALRAG